MEKKIYWLKNLGITDEKYYGAVYKCPEKLGSLEEHDLRISTIDNCEKCARFKGLKMDGWRKLSVYCDEN